MSAVAGLVAVIAFFGAAFTGLIALGRAMNEQPDWRKWRKWCAQWSVVFCCAAVGCSVLPHPKDDQPAQGDTQQVAQNDKPKWQQFDDCLNDPGGLDSDKNLLSCTDEGDDTSGYVAWMHHQGYTEDTVQLGLQHVKQLQAQLDLCIMGGSKNC